MQKNPHYFLLKSDGYFLKIICCQELSKIAQYGHTDTYYHWDDSMYCKGGIVNGSSSPASF